MKTADKNMVLALVFATAACFLAKAQPQTRFAPTTPGAASGGSNGTTRSGGSYVSGGELGSVVQVVRDAEVQAELNLSDEQRQQVTDILARVQAMQGELFEDFRRQRQAHLEDARARSEQRMEKLEEAHRQLATATKKILELLTPAQQKQLQALCRQAAADEAGFQARMAPDKRDGGAGLGGGGGGGGGAGGGPGPGTASPTQIFRGGQPDLVQRPVIPGQGGGGFGGGAGGGGGNFGGSTNSRSGTTWRNEHRNEYQSGGGPGSVVRVISYDRVQEQLRMSDEQRLQIAGITRQVRQMEAGLFSETQTPARTSRIESFEQQRQREESMRQAVARAGEEILQKLKPAQQKRLKEICLQAQGADALFKPEIIQALDLTATQQIKLASMRQEAERQALALYGPGNNHGQPPAPIGPDSHAERLRVQVDTERRMIGSVLTPAQQAKLGQLRGNEFAGAARFRSPNAHWAIDAAASSSSQQSK